MSTEYPSLSPDIFTGVNGPTSPSLKKVGIDKTKVKTIHDVTHFAKLKKKGGCGGRKKKKKSYREHFSGSHVGIGELRDLKGG